MCSALVDAMTAAAISERVAARKKSIEESIENYKRWIEGNQKNLEEVEAKVVRLFEVAARLKAAGFEFELGYWSDSIELTTTEDKLKTLYDVVGRFDGDNKSVELVNARRKLVKVRMTNVEFPFLTVSFEARLPADAKCKIERVKIKAKTESRLVCTA